MNEYVQRVDYQLDARRSEAIIEYPSGVPRYTDVRGNGRSYRLCSRQERWAHASLRTLCDAIDGPTDLAYARTAEEWEWINAFWPHMQMVVDHIAVFEKILAVDGPRVVTDFEHLYFYRNWGDWVRDLELERRLRHRREQTDYTTERVDVLPATDTLPVVTTRYRMVTRTTLQDCEAEVRWLLDWERRERYGMEEARVARSMADEQGQVLSPLWRTVLTWGGLQKNKASADGGGRCGRVISGVYARTDGE